MNYLTNFKSGTKEPGWIERRDSERESKSVRSKLESMGIIAATAEEWNVTLFAKSRSYLGRCGYSRSALVCGWVGGGCRPSSKRETVRDVSK